MRLRRKGRGTRPRIRGTIAAGLVGALCAASTVVAPPAGSVPARETRAGRLWIDPQRTYLVTTDEDPVVRDSVPIELAAYGIGPGDEIRLHRVGDFSIDGPAVSEPQEGMAEKNGMIGVFSASAVLSPECKQVDPARMLPCDRFSRVTDAIDWPAPERRSPLEVRTPPHKGAVITDIPHDFAIGNLSLAVPEGATHLFVAAHDDTFLSSFADNRDLGFDFLLEIYRVTAPGVDELSVRRGGYSNSGVLTSGNVSVSAIGDAVGAVRGTGTLAGVNGGEASFSVTLNRFLFLPIYFGSFAMRDAGADLDSRGMLLFASVTKAGDRFVSIRGFYLDLSRFPWWVGQLSLTITDDG